MRKGDTPSVLLLSLPWTTLSEPSLGLGILKSVLTSEGIPCRVHHLNLFLLRYVTARTYFYLAEQFALNDFVFTAMMEKHVCASQLAALDQHIERLLRDSNGSFAGYSDAGQLRDVILKLRNVAVPAFLDDCLQKVATSDATMVGLTCMFDQTIASVALAKQIKDRWPDKLIVLGGYALEGPVGRQIMTSFPWVDVVAFGDGEDVIGPLARASLDRSLLAEIPGLCFRPRSGEPWQSSHSAGRQVDMNKSPPPDYSDYLEDISELKAVHKVTLNFDTLPIESSRGCWWGQTRHCVFCGIDDQTMRYRAKSADVVMAMLEQMSERYALRQFRFSDYILPHAYFKSLLPRLGALESRYRLSCETKANLNYERFRLLHEAGFVEIQPGVESFSSAVLRRMDKGVSAIQNIYTLLLGLRFGIEVHYNFLFGFPDDDPRDYEVMLGVIPLLYHLMPPISRNNVVTVRFAPMQAMPSRFGISTPLRHDARYDVMFSDAYRASCGFDLDEYCYYFEQPYRNSPALEELYALLRKQIQHWKDLHRTREVQLSFGFDGESIVFVDSRHSEQPKRLVFGRSHADAYRALSIECGPVSSEMDSSLRDALEELIEARLVYREDHRLLGLAVPQEVYADGRAAERSAKWVSPFV